MSDEPFSVQDGGKDWVEDLLFGPPEERAQLIETYRAYLLFVAARKLGSELRPKAGPSDVVQDTIFEAHRDFSQFSGTTVPELKAWLRRILLNNLGKVARQYRCTAKRSMDREVPLSSAAVAAGAAASLIARSDSPSAHLERQERSQRIKLALERLTDSDYNLITWRHFEGLTFDEMGARLGCSSVWARKSCLKAMDRLHAELISLGVLETSARSDSGTHRS